MDRAFQWAISVVPIVIGILYFAGIVFDSSYFRFWGLDSQLFPKTVQETVVRGVLAFTTMSSGAAVVFAIISAAIFFITSMLGYAMYRVRRTIEKTKIGSKIFAEPTSDATTNGSSEPGVSWMNVSAPSAVIMAVALGFLVITFVISLIMSSLSGVGQEVAGRQLDALTEVPWDKDSVNDVVISLKEPAQLSSERRRLVLCTEKRCVFLKENEVETIETSLIESMSSSVTVRCIALGCWSDAPR